MSAQSLGSRAIIGEFYAQLEQAIGLGWLYDLAFRSDSDQESETYKWLGMSPAMREWVGGRQPKGLRDNGLTIANKTFESTLEIPVDWIRRDKTGQIMVRIGDMSDRAAAHPMSLISQFMLAGESSVCYDGQFFFDTDHEEGDSGQQSNDLSIDISTLPVNQHGTITAPSVGEMRECINRAIQQIIGFVDDQGEPMNELASSFAIMCPTSLLNQARAAISLPLVDSGESNYLPNTPDYTIRAIGNARLNSSWSSKFAVFRTDGRVKPFIHQIEEDISMSSKAEGSEYEFDNDAWQFGSKKIENVGYGLWQHACMVTMT